MAPRKRGEGETPLRSLRVDDDPWAPFGVNCDRIGSDKSAVARQFMRWFNREPGAKLPERPTALTADEKAAAIAEEVAARAAREARRRG